MKTVYHLSPIIYHLSRAYYSLKLLLDPAIEGNPYDSCKLGSKPFIKDAEQPRFVLRKRFMFR